MLAINFIRGLKRIVVDVNSDVVKSNFRHLAVRDRDETRETILCAMQLTKS